MTEPFLDPDQPQAGVVISRSAVVPSMFEPTSLIARREIHNWRDRCMEFKMPIVSEENWTGVFLGIAFGLAVALLTVDFPPGSNKKSVLEVALLLTFAFAVALGSIAWQKRKGFRHELHTLAREMESACEAGLAERIPAQRAENQ